MSPAANPSDPDPSARRSAPAPHDARRTAVECARLADRLKGEHIVVLEVEPLIEITDFFVVITGTNRRQIRAISEEIVLAMKRRGLQRTALDGLDAGVWVLADFGDVVVHVFNEEARAYYDLDGLWADAARVDWNGEPGLEDGASNPTTA
ncbi:MAG: ribosome silencing factor [Planctomycetes bacterium]|nr:ribosome silencing factor [Planctomycetota bacterium]